MRDGRTDTQDLTQVLVEEAGASGGEHPEIEELFDYHADLLAPDAARRLEDHLVSCRRCTRLLLDLEPLAEAETPTEEEPVDLGLVASWRELGARIAAQESLRSPAWRFLPPVAAALLVAVLGLGLWVGLLTNRNARLLAAKPNPAVFHVDSLVRAAAGTIPVAVPPDDDFFLLVLTPESRGEFPLYEVELEDETGRRVSSFSGLRLQEYSVWLRLSRYELEAGRYRLRLYGRDEEARTPEGEYLLDLRYL